MKHHPTETSDPSDDLAHLDAARAPTWVSHVRRHARHAPDKVAFRHDGKSTTWTKAAKRIDALARHFVDQGVSPGDRILVLMHNRTELLESLIAINAIGGIAVPANFRLTVSELNYIAQNCEPVGLICDADMFEVATALDVPYSRFLLVAAVEAGDSGPWTDYEVVASAEGAPTTELRISVDDIALIMYTSGTTGRPKGAMLSHQNLQSSGLAMLRTWELWDDSAVALCPAPLFHIGAIGMAIPLIATASTLVIGPTTAFDPEKTLDLIERERVTIAFMVPTQWQSICSSQSIGERDLPLRVMTWGAAPATSALIQQMFECFPKAKATTSFGQTEMSPISCVLRAEDARRKIGSVGKPVDTVEARVIDTSMRDVPQGEVGEIVYRGANLMHGYWNNEEATREAFMGGWFHSGDLVRQDEDGFFYVVDRAKDMIISGGENIYCSEVENVVALHPKVADVAVVARPHPRWTETPVAVIVPRDCTAPPTLEEITLWCRDRLASYKKPTELIVVAELPRNATGKVRKDILRAQF